MVVATWLAGKRMSVADFLWKLDIKVKFLSQFPHLCGWTTSNRVVKITRTSFFMHYLLRYDISSVQEMEKKAELHRDTDTTSEISLLGKMKRRNPHCEMSGQNYPPDG